MSSNIGMKTLTMPYMLAAMLVLYFVELIIFIRARRKSFSPSQLCKFLVKCRHIHILAYTRNHQNYTNLCLYIQDKVHVCQSKDCTFLNLKLYYRLGKTAVKMNYYINISVTLLAYKITTFTYLNQIDIQIPQTINITVQTTQTSIL